MNRKQEEIQAGRGPKYNKNAGAWCQIKIQHQAVHIKKKEKKKKYSSKVEVILRWERVGEYIVNE